MPEAEATAESATRRRRLHSYLDLVRFEHTLFALPFAYAGMLVAAGGWPGWATFGWITVAMVGARTAAMALNRLIDARLDALNPRTAGRELPKGVLGRVDALVLAFIGFALLALAGWALNPLTLALLPVAVAALTLYSYTKRISWLCHLWLGATIGAAAAGGWIGVTGSFSAGAVCLWLGVALWIAGFDVIYGMLDFEFDREHRIQSIPARFGLKRAVTISGVMHGLAVAALLLLVPLTRMGVVYLAAVALVAAVLLRSHLLVRTRGAGVALAAFNANLYVSSLVLAGVVLDLLL